jgi:hypothetical protein
MFCLQPWAIDAAFQGSGCFAAIPELDRSAGHVSFIRSKFCDAVPRDQEDAAGRNSRNIFVRAVVAHLASPFHFTV